MKVLLSMIGLISMSLVVGCGNTPTETVDAGPDQYKSGSCGSRVIEDYNGAAIECSYNASQEDVNACVDQLERFKGKYPGINCVAETGFGLDREKITVTEEHIDDLINKAREA